MTKILHLLHREPDQQVAELISLLGRQAGITVVCLYPDAVTGRPVDWSRVLDDIFAHDTIMCWW
jgi:hypothetical protein